MPSRKPVLCFPVFRYEDDDRRSDSDSSDAEKKKTEAAVAKAATEGVAAAEEEPLPETRIEVEVPKISTEQGKELHFVKLPNFLSVDCR